MTISKNHKITFGSFVVLISLLVGVILVWSINSPKSNFVMDVNPSIQITTNRIDRVLSIEPLNEDARILMAHYRNSEKKLEVVIEELLDLMILKGYITSEEESKVRITFNDGQTDKEILNRVNRSVSDYFATKQINTRQVVTNKSRDSSRMITMDQASDLVINKSGQTNTSIQKNDFIWENLEPLYQGEAFNKGVKYSFEIYAYSGEFQKWDASDDETWTEMYFDVK